jgi:MFS transporter, DHA1 family, tetracycline resistance protein
LPETLPPEKRRPFELYRANPFGTFKVFQSYKGVLPLCIVMFVYFFASAVYPAIWPFWGIAKFGWSELFIGLTLAAFGVVTAVFQGVLTGPAEKYFGSSNVVLIGLVSSVIAVIGYGMAPGLLAVVILFIVHGPEGFVHPMLSALMSKAVPDNAQGELQGGISSIMSVAMLLGTVFFSQVFAWFMQPNALVQSPNVAMYVAAGFLALSLLIFLKIHRKPAR